ncbi:MAG: flippase [Lachnospiraceae bacterium]|nr:flippase [Lachnospiraceae bacterium]
MAKKKTVKFNFLMNVILTGSSFLFPIITFPYISRVLLPEGVGRVNFATAIASYFTMFAMLGVPTYGVRACAKVRDDRQELSRTVQEILIINLIVGMVAYVVYFIAIWKIPRLRSDSVLFYLMSTTIFFNVVGVDWMYKGLEEYSYITVRSLLFKFLALILMFWFVKEQKDYVIYGAISILASVGSNFLNLLNLRKYITLRPVGNYCIVRHLKPIMVFFFMSVATTVYTNLDTVMLGFMKTDVDVGYYSAAVKVKNILISMVTALGTVLLPRVSYYIEHNMEEEFIRISRKALNFVVITALPLTVYFIFFAEESVLLLSGDSFTGAILPMQLIMPTILFVGITNMLGMQILVPLDKENLVFYSVLAGAIVDLIVNILCIPSMASAGAALGTLIAELVVLLIQLFMLRDRIRQFIESLQLGKIIMAVFVGSLACIWVKHLQLSSFFALLVSALLFFGSYGLLLFLLKENFLYETVMQLWKTKIKRGG